MFVKFAPLTAGKVAGNLASGIVPDANLLAARAVMLESGIFVKFAPDPENVVAVHTPVKNKSPSSLAVTPVPTFKVETVVIPDISTQVGDNVIVPTPV